MAVDCAVGVNGTERQAIAFRFVLGTYSSDSEEMDPGWSPKATLPV